MENKDRDDALEATPQNEPIYYGVDQEVFERYYASQPNPDPEEEEVKEEEEEDEKSDWGHTDPTDSPFPDSNDPSGPGSAV